MKFKKRRS